MILTGGGTGGHIFPAISIANSIKRKRPDSDILFVGAEGRLEEKIVPENNYKIETVKISGLNKRNVLKNISLPYKLYSSVKRCKKIIKEFNPDAVIGTGGFASAPLIYNAKKLKIPYFLQEGNSYPGKVTRYFSEKAEKVFINFEETKSDLKRKDNVIRAAHPIRNFLAEDKNNSKEYFGIENSDFTLFVFGGSQGSVSINNAMEKNIESLVNYDINIIWQTGISSFERYSKLSGRYNGKVKVHAFIKEMCKAYTASDLVVCRSGIGSIMELAAMSKPCILVPFPFAAENHQEKNAKTLEAAGACRLLSDDNLGANLTDLVLSLRDSNDELEMLAKNINTFSDPLSSDKIAEEILNSIR